jgi:hypothetical protein
MIFTKFETCFCNGSSIIAAISRYNQQHNKSCKSVTSTGRKKVYKCQDDGCEFVLEFLRKRASNNIRQSHVSHVPDGHWYVYNYKRHGNSCMSTHSLSASELVEMPAFYSTVTASRNQSASVDVLKQVVSETHDFGGVTTNKIQRAREMVRKMNENENDDSYCNIPNLCNDVITHNPGSHICCQVDSEGRFYRLFIILKSSLKALEGCLPCLEIDGTL